MDKKILLEMQDNKSIEISVNDDVSIVIQESNRVISAQSIYEIIDYQIGDTLSIKTKNDKDVDSPVLNYFKELFDNIIERINELDLDEEDSIVDEDDIGE